MYKPVPQGQSSSNDGEDSESELFNSALNYDEKSFQCDDHTGDSTSQQQLMEPSMSMSTGRKVALGFSIVNCVAFIIIFLWVLPCDYDTCKAPLKIKFIEWEVNLTGKGVQAMSMTSSKTRSKEMLVLLNIEYAYSNSSCPSNQSNNVLALQAADGKIVWEKNLTEAVHYLNCSIVDVNNDGVDDCLLFPVDNKLSALDSLTGALVWKFQYSQQAVKNQASGIKILDINSVADLNNDAVSDLILLVNDTGIRYFIGLSGKNGKMLWQFPLNTSCIPIDRPASIDYVISNSCIKELPGFAETNTTTRLLIRRALQSNFPPCLKCDSLTNGIPKTHYLFHGTVNRFLVTAIVNCTSGTLVKKTNLY